jgi:hypothetical protein
MARLTEKQMVEMALRTAVDGSVEKLNHLANLFSDYATKLRGRATEIEEYGTTVSDTPSIASRNDLFNWAINDAENCIRNINFSNLARTATGLALAEIEFNNQKP